MSQNFDHTSQIYRRIIDETITGACRLQSEAVLRELRQKWLAKLAERIQQMPAKRVEADLQRINEANRAADRQVKQVKTEIPDTMDTGHAAPMPQLQPMVGAGVWDTALAFSSFNEPAAAIPGAGPAPGAGPPPGSALTTGSGPRPAASTSGLLGPTDTPHQEEPNQEEPNTAVDGTGVDGTGGGTATAGAGDTTQPSPQANEDDDDGWGEWEDPETLEAKPKDVPKAAVVPEVVEVEKEEELDPSIPKDADFAAKLRTQYGGGAYGDGDDPDEINSDLDEVKTLSDDEPVAHDVIIGQCEELVRPGARKAQMQGTWEIRVKNGVASVNGQEFMFDTLEATLEF